MKAAVTGYITAVINNYTRAIENLKTVKTAPITISKYETIREELNDLLDFIEDIPEETGGPITVVLNSNNEEVEILRKRIRELEDSCENMAQVEKNLNAKIKLYDVENQRLLSLCRQYNAKGIR